VGADSRRAPLELAAHLIDALGEALAIKAQEDDLEDGGFELVPGASQERPTRFDVRADLARIPCQHRRSSVTTHNSAEGFFWARVGRRREDDAARVIVEADAFQLAAFAALHIAVRSMHGSVD